MLEKLRRYVADKIETALDEFIDCTFAQPGDRDVFSGSLVMKSVQLKPAALDLINERLPIIMLERIQIETVSVKLPWDAVTTEPTDVRVQGVLVIAKVREFGKPVEQPRTKREEPKPGLGSFVTRLINQLIDMVQIKDLTVCFVDERAGTRLVLAAELDELRVETADKHWVGKFFDEAIKADEFSLCNLSLCSLLCCGPNKKEYKLVAIHNLRAWWTTEQDLDVSQHQWGTDPSGVFWLLKPFSCKAKATFDRNSSDTTTAKCGVVFEIPPVLFEVQCDLLFALRSISSYTASLPHKLEEQADSAADQPKRPTSSEDKDAAKDEMNDFVGQDLSKPSNTKLAGAGAPSKPLIKIELSMKDIRVFLGMQRGLSSSDPAAASGLTAGLAHSELKIAIGSRLDFDVVLGEINIKDSNPAAHFPQIVYNCSDDPNAPLLQLEGYLVDEQAIRCVLDVAPVMVVAPVVGCVQDLLEMMEPLLRAGHKKSSESEQLTGQAAEAEDVVEVNLKDGWAHRLPEVEILIALHSVSVFFPARGTTQSYGHGTLFVASGNLSCDCCDKPERLDKPSTGGIWPCCGEKPVARRTPFAKMHAIRGGKPAQSTELKFLVTDAVVAAAGEEAAFAKLNTHHDLCCTTKLADAALDSLVIEVRHTLREGDVWLAIELNQLDAHATIGSARLDLRCDVDTDIKFAHAQPIAQRIADARNKLATYTGANGGQLAASGGYYCVGYSAGPIMLSAGTSLSKQKLCVQLEPVIELGRSNYTNIYYILASMHSVQITTLPNTNSDFIMEQNIPIEAIVAGSEAGGGMLVLLPELKIRVAAEEIQLAIVLAKSIVEGVQEATSSIPILNSMLSHKTSTANVLSAQPFSVRLVTERPADGKVIRADSQSEASMDVLVVAKPIDVSLFDPFGYLAVITCSIDQIAATGNRQGEMLCELVIGVVGSQSDVRSGEHIVHGALLRKTQIKLRLTRDNLWSERCLLIELDPLEVTLTPSAADFVIQALMDTGDGGDDPLELGDQARLVIKNCLLSTTTVVKLQVTSQDPETMVNAGPEGTTPETICTLNPGDHIELHNSAVWFRVLPQPTLTNGWTRIGQGSAHIAKLRRVGKSGNGNNTRVCIEKSDIGQSGTLGDAVESLTSVPPEYLKQDLIAVRESDDENDNATLLYGPDPDGYMYEIEHTRSLNMYMSHDCMAKVWRRMATPLEAEAAADRSGLVSDAVGPLRDCYEVKRNGYQVVVLVRSVVSVQNNLDVEVKVVLEKPGEVTDVRRVAAHDACYVPVRFVHPDATLSVHIAENQAVRDLIEETPIRKSACLGDSVLELSKVPREFVQQDFDMLQSSDDYDNSTLVYGPDEDGAMYEIEHFRILNTNLRHDCQCKAYVRSKEMRAKPLVLPKQPILGGAEIADSTEFASVPGVHLSLFEDGPVVVNQQLNDRIRHWVLQPRFQMINLLMCPVIFSFSTATGPVTVAAGATKSLLLSGRNVQLALAVEGGAWSKKVTLQQRDGKYRLKLPTGDGEYCVVLDRHICTGGVEKLTVSAQYWVLNTTPWPVCAVRKTPVEFEPNSTNYEMLAVNAASCSFKVADSDWSSVVNIKTLGARASFTVSNGQQEFSVAISISLAPQPYEGFTLIIRLEPMMRLFNYSGSMLYLVSDKPVATLESIEKTNACGAACTWLQKEKIKITTTKDAATTSVSPQLDLMEVGHKCVRMTSSDGTTTSFMNVSTSIGGNGASKTVLDNAPSHKAPLQVLNYTRHHLTFRQHSTAIFADKSTRGQGQQKATRLMPFSTAPFALDEGFKKVLISVHVTPDVTTAPSIVDIEVPTNQVGTYPPVELEEMTIYVTVLPQDSLCIVVSNIPFEQQMGASLHVEAPAPLATVTPAEREQRCCPHPAAPRGCFTSCVPSSCGTTSATRRATQLNNAEHQGGTDADRGDWFKLEIRAPHIGVSVVSETPEEIAYLVLSEFKLHYRKLTADVIVNVKLDNLQLNDQRNNNAFQPHFKVPISKVATPSPKPLVEISILKSLQSPQLYKHITLLVQAIEVQVSEDFLAALVAQIPSLLTNSKDPWYSSGPVKPPKMLPPSVGKGGTPFWCDDFVIHPIKIYVSFLSASDKAHRLPQLDSVREMLALAGLTELQHVPISLSSLSVQSMYEEPKSFASRLAFHYITQGVSQAYRVLGSSDLLGDPVGLFDSVGDGVSALFYDPFMVEVQDPLDLAKGIGSGALTLVGSVYSGALTTVEKVFKGLSGLVKGAQSAVEKGLTRSEDGEAFIEEEFVSDLLSPSADAGAGIVTDGTGIITGVTAGVLDGVAAGFHTAASLGIRDKGLAERSRPPRAFGANGTLVPFCADSASAQDLVVQAGLTTETCQHFTTLWHPQIENADESRVCCNRPKDPELTTGPEFVVLTERYLVVQQTDELPLAVLLADASFSPVHLPGLNGAESDSVQLHVNWTVARARNCRMCYTGDALDELKTIVAMVQDTSTTQFLEVLPLIDDLRE